MSDAYVLNSSQQLMENHIAAAVLDASNGFWSCQTPVGATVVLAIGDDQILRASVESSGGSVAWAIQDLSSALSSFFPPQEGEPTFVAKSFAASLDSTSGALTILAAVTVTAATASSDYLCALTGPPQTDPSVWLADPNQQTWTQLVYDGVVPASFGNITPTTLTIDLVKVEMGMGSTTPSLALAAVRSPILADVDCIFILNINGGSGPNPNVWNYFPQEQEVTPNVQIAIGCVPEGGGWGVFKLYGESPNQSLTFLPASTTQAPAIIYETPPGASAITSLTYTANGETVSDLFVASDSCISRFPYNIRKPNAGTTVVQPSGYISTVSRIQAVNAGDTALLWWLNGVDSAGASQVIFSQAPLDALETWQTPLVLLSGVAAAAPVFGAPANQCGLCAMMELPQGTAVGPSIPASGPVMLSRNVTTSHWQKNVLPMPQTTDCIVLKTYTTRVQLLSGIAPAVNETVSISPSVDCTLYINQQATPVTAGAAVSMTTDTGGYINLVYPVSSFAGLSFTFTFGSSTQPQQLIVDASSNTTAQLAAVTPTSLSNATYQDANGNTQHLVQPGSPAAQNVGQAAGYISQLGQLPATLSFAHQLSEAHRRHRSGPHLSMARGTMADPIAVGLGDLLQCAENFIGDVGDFILEGVNLTISLGDIFYTAVIETVEDALQAISAVLAWVGAAFEAAFRWLAFLFSWDDIVDIHNDLKGAVNNILSGYVDNGSAIIAASSAYLASLILVLNPQSGASVLSNVAGGSPSAAYNSQASVPPPVGSSNTSLQGDSRVGWMNDRMSTAPTSTGSTSSVRRVMRDGAPTAFQNAADALDNAFSTFVSDLEADILSLVSSEGSGPSFLQAIVTQIATMGLEDVQAVLNALETDVEDVVAAFQDVLNDEIEIPILTPLYDAATGDQLTPLSLACLLAAIAINLSYDIATGNSASTAVDQAQLPQGMIGVMNGLAANIPTAVGQRSAQRLGASEADSSTVAITGGLMIAQSVTAFALGGFEMIGYEGFCKFTYLIDLLIRLVRGGVEAQVTSPAYAPSKMITLEFHTTLVISVLTFTAGTQYMRIVDAAASVGWGIWEIWEMCPGIDAGHTFEAGVELLEPVVSILAHYAEESDNADVIAAAVVAIGLRVESALGAGIVRLES